MSPLGAGPRIYVVMAREVSRCVAREVFEAMYICSACQRCCGEMSFDLCCTGQGQVVTHSTPSGQFPELRPKVRPKVRPEVRPEDSPKVSPKVRPKVRPEVRHNVRPKDRTKVRPKVRPFRSTSLAVETPCSVLHCSVWRERVMRVPPLPS